MAPTIALPAERDGRWVVAPYTLSAPRIFPVRPAQPFNRVIYSAAHVVAQPLTTRDPWQDCPLDWDATIAYRVHLWKLGLGVAEAMDTAQRGTGLDWSTALLLIRECVRASHGIPGARVAAGCGTDHLLPESTQSIDDVIAAYEEQMAAIEAIGCRLILMASRALARVARSPDDYLRVYDRLLRQAREPVILHWLGEMFDPSLAGYWGHADHGVAMEVTLELIGRNVAKVEGIKISLLNKDLEIAMRRRLPTTVRMYTGDDYNFPELIAGDPLGYSDALLGILDPIAPAAAAALAALAQGDVAEFHRILTPTVPLSRHIFGHPTRFYKTGVVFLAYLNGFQNHFTMIGGQQSARSIQHLSELFRLADRAGLLTDPVRACDRMRSVLAVHGVS